jgi:cholesterol transport system auxiliary component
VQVLGRNWFAGRATILAAMALLVGGCGSLGIGSKGPPPTYDLSAPNIFPRSVRPPRGQIVIPNATAISALESEKIIVRPAHGQISALADAQWSDQVTKLVQIRAIQAFENANRLRAVGRPSDRIAADYQLLLDIRAFEILVSRGPVVAEVEISAKIVGERSGRIIAARVFKATVPTTAAQGPAAVAALDAAFVKVVTDIVLWATRII